MLIGAGSAVQAQPLATGNTQNSAAPRTIATAAPSTTMPTRPMKRFTGGQDYMYQTQVLKDPIQTSALPQYRGNGAKYTTGLYYPNLKGRQCYIMRYLAKESDREIMHSYRDSLVQNGWQVIDTQTNARQLTATRKANGLYLTLFVYPSSKPDFKSSFEIKYLTSGAVQSQSM
jgi:hypothetical protein